MNLPTSGILLDMKLSERVKYVVDNRPISASAWSLKAGKSRGYAQKLTERDAIRPDAAALRRMADVVGVPRDWFVEGEGDPPVFAEFARPGDEVRLERDPTPAINPPEGASPLVQAVTQAFDKTRHLITDANAVIDALTNSIDAHTAVDVDLIEKALVWLNAAAALRREGRAVNAGTLLDRVTGGRSPLLAPDAEDAFQREIAEVAARHGVMFGQAKAAVEAFQRGEKPAPRDLDAAERALGKRAGEGIDETSGKKGGRE